jgi:hypothetical protein
MPVKRLVMDFDLIDSLFESKTRSGNGFCYLMKLSVRVSNDPKNQDSAAADSDLPASLIAGSEKAGGCHRS